MAHKSFADINAAEKAKEDAKGGSYEYEKVEQMKACIIKAGDAKVVRWVGEVPMYAERDTDATEVLSSWVRTADNKMKPIIWSKDETHPLYELKKTVLGKYSYDKENKKYIYENEGKGIESFNIWMKPNPSPRAFGSMSPTKKYLVNVIDRSDSWCKDNKHTKVLALSSQIQVKEDGTEVEYPAYGIGTGAWNSLWKEHCVKISQHPEDLDFLLQHYTDDEKPSNTKTVDWIDSEQKRVITALETKLNKKFTFNDEPLTVEEEAYEKYSFKDVPFVSKPTSCAQIIKILGWYIKLVDAEKGTNLFELFQTRAAKEKEEWLKTLPKDSDTTTEVKTEPVETTSPSFDSMKGVDIEVPTEEVPNFEPPKSTRGPVTRAPEKTLRIDFENSNEANEAYELVQTDEYSPSNMTDAEVVSNLCERYSDFDPSVIKSWLSTNFGINA